MNNRTSGNIEYLITGSGGQLGSELCRQLDARALGIDIDELDITDRASVRKTLAALSPRVLINTAAYTAVDKAEESPDICKRVNCDAVAILAEESAAIGAELVQISTDYVFGSPPEQRQPHIETATTSAAGVYAQTKLAAEQHAATNPKHFIVRTCGLYGQPGPTSAGNFVTTMIKLGTEREQVRVVDDQHCTPTWVPELATAIRFLTDHESSMNATYGTYHIVNGGETTWFDMAREIFRLANIQCEVEAITTEQFGALAHRPPYSVLSTEKYHRLGGPKMSPWAEALAKYVGELMNNRTQE